MTASCMMYATLADVSQMHNVSRFAHEMQPIRASNAHHVQRRAHVYMDA